MDFQMRMMIQGDLRLMKESCQIVLAHQVVYWVKDSHQVAVGSGHLGVFVEDLEEVQELEEV